MSLVSKAWHILPQEQQSRFYSWPVFVLPPSLKIPIRAQFGLHPHPLVLPVESSLHAAGGGVTKMASSLSDFTNTFVLSSVPPSKQDQQLLLEVPKALLIDPVRQRRAHQKSKTGCENCKRRRVKVESSYGL